MDRRATVVLCLCIALAYGQNNNHGMWGDWGQPSDCSRTCGGGVSHRTRKCHHGMRPGLSPGCQGEDIRYESCNTQPCPEGLDSFRSVQCARFNSEQVTWLPYQDDSGSSSSSQCQLVCQDSRTGRVEVLQERVVDGTECDSPLSFGICLGGACQSVGCDRHIRSRQREDHCLKCGGRGDTCHLVTDSFTQNDLSLGDNDIAIIPLGATSILLEEVSAFPSLVLTSRDGSVHLDSRRPPSNGTVLRVGGASLLYLTAETLPQGTQRHELKGRGPTNDTLIVKLRDYGREKTTVDYRYYIPKNRLLESNPNQPYSWIFGAWTSCSQECGDGYQLRAVSCIDRSSGGSVEDSLCDDSKKPDARKECNIKPCGTADNWYRWVPGHWGKCSVKCGVGEQTQAMYCVETGPSGDTVYVKEELCERYSDKHPIYKRACEGDGEECPYWATTAWTQCSVTCGHGTQSRQVLCQRDPTNPSKDPEVVEESQCTQDRPDTHRACVLDPCPDGSNAHGMVEVEDDKDCENSEYGCCEDGVTFASGPSGGGCPSKAPSYNVCLLEPERGTCSDYSIRWHFVPNENECRRFWYGGCRGNGNRFETEEECVAKCMHSDEAPGDSSSSGDCRSRVHGCCPDGVTAARGPNNEGCPSVVDSSSEDHCHRSRFGCCADGVTKATGPNKAGCPGVSDNEINDNDHDNRINDNSNSNSNSNREAACQRSQYGCCADGVTAARGPRQEGCREREPRKNCEQSYYGCCPGTDVAAKGPNYAGCSVPSSAATLDFDPAVCAEGEDRGTCTDYSVKWYYDVKESGCKRFWYGGCGGNGNVFDSEEKCKLGCVDVTGRALCRLPSVAGPCRSLQPRYFYDHKAGECRRFTYGGCRGNSNRFLTRGDCEKQCQGPGGDGVPSSSGHGDSAGDDHHSKAGGDDEDPNNRGNEILPSNQVDDCRGSRYGCCRDGVTAASGPSYQGCPQPCQSSQYGCCPDGITYAQGYNRQGCQEEINIGDGGGDDEDDGGEGGSGMFADCQISRYGCCPDGVTSASGPNQRGCVSRTTPTTTTPRPTTTTTTTTTTPPPPVTKTVKVPAGGREKCSGASERGPCSNYEVKWYFNTERQECAQFWYGGCQGSHNRYDTRDECEAECLATEAPVTEDPDFISICDMPKDPGPCSSQISRWFYDPLDRQCRTFYWSGCPGNENNFLSLRDCQQTCMGVAPDAGPATAATTTTTTTPAPYTFNPPPVTSSLTMTGSEKVVEGSELRLTCRADGPSIPQEIEWFINGKRIGREHDKLSIRSQRTPSEHSLTSELVISYSRKENTATYYCRSIPYGDVQRRTVVIVKTGVEARTTTTTTTTTEAPVSRPEVPDRGPSDPYTVCRMAKEPGNCRGYFPRWHYDWDSRTCRQFVYGGCNSNSNNFETEQDCLDYCQRDDVEPERPEDPTDPDDVCRMPAVTGQCRAHITRWYYDASLGGCRQFVYGGCSGNSNNFETENDCLNYCGRGPGSGVTPVTSAPVPSNDPNVVCQQPSETGRCRAYFPRYHYNVTEGQCMQFTYGGCGGNSNNFETLEACNNFCRAEDICKQPKVTGPCRAAIPRFHYDSASGSCQAFIYGGCQGNLNNFGSLEACQTKCQGHGSSSRVGPASGSQEEVCKLNPDAGTCRGYDIKWYYDSSLQNCQRFVYTGCDGNGNRFSTENECLQFCRTGVDTVFTPAPVQPSGDVCSLSRERGPCSDYEIMWYYDTEQGRCSRFYYGGCQGNDNRFATEEECDARCAGSPTERSNIPTTPAPRRRACSYSRYGCCQDGFTAAIDAFRSNCGDDSVVVRPSGDGSMVLANRGSMAILNCNSPGAAISWYRDGYFLTSDSRFQIYNNGTLVIRNINDDIIGHYACRITDGNNIPQVRRYELKLKDGYQPEGNQVPLSILQTPPTITVPPGVSAYLHCQAFGTPTPTVSWSFRGNALYSGGRTVLFNNGTLMITGVSEQDIGTYTCTAQNGVDNPVTRNMELAIAQRLEADIQSHTGVAVEGETVRLRCDVSGYPTPTVTWEKNGKAVAASPSSKAYQQGNNLVVPQVGIDDAGVYTCVATNNKGSARDITYLQINLMSHRDKCVNTMSKMKCHLIVSARLCGHRMFARKCCLSCQKAGLLRRK